MSRGRTANAALLTTSSGYASHSEFTTPSGTAIHPSTGGEGCATKNSPPVEGCQLQADGVVKKKRSYIKYLELPYNPKLRQRAKELRKARNLSEVLLWNQLKRKQFEGYDFDRQKIIGNFIVDFFCTNLGLVIEVDGSSHDNKLEYDQQRQMYLESLGLKVFRVTDLNVKHNMDGVLKELREVAVKISIHDFRTKDL